MFNEMLSRVFWLDRGNLRCINSRVEICTIVLLSLVVSSAFLCILFSLLSFKVKFSLVLLKNI